MPGSRHPNPPPPPAPPRLDHYSESIRRTLYDLVVAVQFPGEPSEDPDVFVPWYSPEEAGLVVFWMYGRYFAAWQQLEEMGEPYSPVDRRWELLRITLKPEAPCGVDFDAV